ncbi:MAG: phosphoribosylformylglycinamidine synthase [Rickettsiales bacterium]|jgi:phosphoribosylformylglycinamidine synthase|nr:phosphoribosylformylglycinamidine synthase [Rickettsiales bacterium]
MARNIHFFRNNGNSKLVYAAEHNGKLSKEYIEKLEYLTNGEYDDSDRIAENFSFVGTRRERETPFSTSATEIARAAGVHGITRIESYVRADETNPEFDRMLQSVYPMLGQDIFNIDREAQPIKHIQDIRGYNKEHGLALSEEEIEYLEKYAAARGASLTDAELMGFCQANSEHCRHKIFNGEFWIDGKRQDKTLFQMIKETTLDKSSATGYKGNVKNAYGDNAAVMDSMDMVQWSPNENGEMVKKPIRVGWTLKAETHNHPTGVSPFPGAATGTGGEIRDRMSVGHGSVPLSGTLVIMTNPLDSKKEYLYSSPQQILTEGTDGAFHYANEYGQPLTNARVFTFEHSENGINWGYNKPILQAGGVGYVNEKFMKKDESRVKPGQKIILLGGSNYLVGLGGGSAASLNSGATTKAVDFASVQRDNAEMQNRVFRVIRACAESAKNPIVSVHDHGAGGHFNCLVELVEKTGGKIYMDRLPVGDKTMSAREIISNESQEREGLLVDEADVKKVLATAKREGCPAFVIGELTGDLKFAFEQADGDKPVDMDLESILRNPPKTIMKDSRVKHEFADAVCSNGHFEENLRNVLSMTSVGSRDWMTNKVDRSVTGLVAQQPCVGELQLPVCKYGITKFDLDTDAGVAEAVGFAPVAALIDAASGSRLAIADALTPLIFAPLKDGLSGVALSANWMWPCRNPGEDARLYDAVLAVRDFCLSLGITVPTGKDSLSMTQSVAGEKTRAPGTVIISSGGTVQGIEKKVLPVMDAKTESVLYQIDMSFASMNLGGSALAQSLGFVGGESPDVRSAEHFKDAFEAVQAALSEGLILAGNSISSGGMITALLEMTFANTKGGVKLWSLSDDMHPEMFSENPGVIVQVAKKDTARFEEILFNPKYNFMKNMAARIGETIPERKLEIVRENERPISLDIDSLREDWMRPSAELEKFQNKRAKERRANIFKQPLVVDDMTRGLKYININKNAKRKTTAAVIRDKGVNGDREMQYAAKMGGFDAVRDITMTDLMEGRENLTDADMAIFAGGFSNADAFAAGRGWAAKFKYNARANDALMNFYGRGNTLILGVCNGCQVLMELGLIGGKPSPMQRNDSGKFESAFVSTQIPANSSVMLGELSGIAMPVWVAHGEGKFDLSNIRFGRDYQIVLKYAYEQYPGNPNGSYMGVAGIASMDGRIVAMMPHPERAILPHQWAWNPGVKLWTPGDLAAMPWLQMFASANNHFTR